MTDPGADLDGADWDRLVALVVADQPDDVRAAGLAWLRVADAADAQLTVLEDGHRHLSPRWRSPAGEEYLSRLADAAAALRETAAIARHNHLVMDAAADDLRRAQFEFTAVADVPLAEPERAAKGREILKSLNGRYEQAIADFREVPAAPVGFGVAPSGSSRGTPSATSMIAQISMSGSGLDAPLPGGPEPGVGAGAGVTDRPTPLAKPRMPSQPEALEPHEPDPGPILGGADPVPPWPPSVPPPAGGIGGIGGPPAGEVVDGPGVGVPGADAPSGGGPGRARPGLGVPGVGVPVLGVPGLGVPGVGVPVLGVPGLGVPGVGVPGLGVPGVGVPGAGGPEARNGVAAGTRGGPGQGVRPGGGAGPGTGAGLGALAPVGRTASPPGGPVTGQARPAVRPRVPVPNQPGGPPARPAEMERTTTEYVDEQGNRITIRRSTEESPESGGR